MKVLNIGMDRKLFEEGSSVLGRSGDYASEMEELHVIVFSLRKLGLKYVHKGKLHIHPTNSSYRIKYISDAIKLGQKIIKENNFKKGDSVITTQDPFETGLVGYKLKNKFSLPLQIQIHTDFLSPYFKNSFLNNIRVILARFLIPKADGLRVVSSVISDSIKKQFPNLKAQIYSLPIFVDVEKIKVKQSVDFNKIINIVMASRLSSEKRIDVAIKAVKIVISKFNNVNLHVFGRGPEEVKLKNLSESLSILDKKIVFSDWEDISNIYSKADIFLLTSEYEGYGMTLIEAGASGCPIVTTKVGIAKTDLFKNGENSYVCEVGDVDCLSKSIINLLEDSEKRKLFKDRMQDSIKKIAISRKEYVEKYVDLLEKIK